MKSFSTIVLGTIVVSCCLGIGVDLITANVAVEYFSIHHPTIVETDNPWILAFIWGIVATWWFGAAAGIVLAATNHFRNQPLPPRRILTWTAIACFILWMLMMSVLIGIYLFAENVPYEKRSVTFESDRRLIAVAMAHQYEYVLGGIATLILTVCTWRTANTPEREENNPT